MELFGKSHVLHYFFGLLYYFYSMMSPGRYQSKELKKSSKLSIKKFIVARCSPLAGESSITFDLKGQAA
jgi:hypothetical protein